MRRGSEWHTRVAGSGGRNVCGGGVDMGFAGKAIRGREREFYNWNVKSFTARGVRLDKANDVFC